MYIIHKIIMLRQLYDLKSKYTISKYSNPLELNSTATDQTTHNSPTAVLSNNWLSLRRAILCNSLPLLLKKYSKSIDTFRRDFHNAIQLDWLTCQVFTTTPSRSYIYSVRNQTELCLEHLLPHRPRGYVDVALFVVD